MKLDDSQRKAICSVFQNKLTVITGAGGSGKTTICRFIYEIAQKKRLTVRMMSPTGKASQILSEKTGCPATTIHRGLKLLPGNDFPKEDIDEDILLIDEISMAGLDTVFAIMKALEENKWCHIVLVGDKNQLPSVSPGNFLNDILKSNCANIVVLDKIHRQDDKSFIPLVAKEISDGNSTTIPVGASDIKWKHLNVDKVEQDLVKFVDKYLDSGNKIDDLQIMSPMKKGRCGVYKLNSAMQEKMAIVNNTADQHLVLPFGKFYVGDRIIQTVNNYDKMIFNGDMGVVVDVGEKIANSKASDKKERFITVQFYGSEELTFWGEEIEQIILAWVITVHKFQGSQAKNIIFMMASEAQVLMSKELVYTAFTRAEKKLVIFGHEQMLRYAPTKSVIRKRFTNFNVIIDSIVNNGKGLTVLGA
jgi:exodeoxyribonuclease V alpha subunit